MRHLFRSAPLASVLAVLAAVASAQPPPGGDFQRGPSAAMLLGQEPVQKELEPAHPLNAMFDGRDFEINDEIYQFTLTSALPTERKFLLALDVSKMPDARRGIRKEGGPYPISWVSTYGKGRTFYCSLGHREEIFCEPTILKHYLAGIQYALGDLEVDAAPTVKPAED